MSIKAMAFESLVNPGKYVSDGLDVPSCDENGETDVIEDALLIIRKDHELPDEKDIEAFHEFLDGLNFFDAAAFKTMSKPVPVEITEEQLAAIRERNEW